MPGEINLGFVIFDTVVQKRHYTTKPLQYTFMEKIMCIHHLVFSLSVFHVLKVCLIGSLLNNFAFPGLKLLRFPWLIIHYLF